MRHEPPERLGERDAHGGDDPQDRGGEVHRPPPHGIRETTRRQLEGEGHETADGEGRRRLGDGQPAPGLEQDDDADDEPDGQRVVVRT